MNANYSTCAVVDSSGLLKTLQGALQGGYRREEQLIAILDFLALAEGIVLNDQLLVVEAGLGFAGGLGRHTQRDREGKEIEQENEGWHELIKPLHEAGIIESKPVQVQAERLPDTLKSKGAPLSQDAWFETGRIIGAEKQFKVAALPMMRQRQVYETFSNTSLHHSITDLSGRYESLKEILAKLRSSMGSTADYLMLPIPPIGINILNRCSSREDLIVRALEVREGYSSLRRSLSELRHDLADPYTSPKKKTQLIKSWAKSWRTLATYEDSLSVVELANTTTGMLESERELAASAASAITMNPEGMISALIKKGMEAVSSWRVRVLHQTARNYLNTSDHAMALLTERVFQVNLSMRELEKVNNATSPK